MVGTGHGASGRPTLGRRAFLAGGAGALALAACGSGNGDSAGPTTAAPGFALLQLFDPTPLYARAGVAQRLTWGLGDAAGIALSDLPSELTFHLRFDGAPGDTAPVREVVGEPITVTAHAEGLPRGYFPLRFTPDREGTWSVKVTHAGQDLEGLFQVGPPGGPGVVELGRPMPSFASATTAAPQGVTPLCTRAEPCPFHEQSLDEALAGGTPVVVSVSTPLYCQVEVCGPVLDLLVDAAADYPDVAFVHLEPYQAPEPGNPSAGGTVPAMEELGLTFEPSLFLVGADGVLADRLDNVYDTAELAEGLDRLVAG